MPESSISPTLSDRWNNWRCNQRPFHRVVRAFKRSHPVYRAAKLPAVSARTVVSETRRYLFIRIPKVANTTLLTTLWLCENGLGPSDLDRYSEAERKQLLRKQAMKESFVALSDLTAGQSKDVLTNYTKCIFVRNPFERLASSYIYKIERGSAWRKLGFGGSTSLAGFCDFLADGGLHVDVHWMPQSHFCTAPIESLDFIGRMETLVDDLGTLIQRLYGRPAPLLNRQHHATGASRRVRELFGPREIQMACELYADDFKAFGYSTDPY